MLILKTFASQMANHVAPWEDKDGWTHSNCPEGRSFPEMVCRISRYLEYPQCPEYAAKEVTKNEELVHKVYIYLPPHPERSHILHETGPTLREAYEAAALATLTELCERHSRDLDIAPASYLLVCHQADGPWRDRHQQMIEYQRETSDYGRSVTGGQLATTAEYALNAFNLQYDQRLELCHLRQ